jgi:hypothetical protein
LNSSNSGNEGRTRRFGSQTAFRKPSNSEVARSLRSPSGQRRRCGPAQADARPTADSGRGKCLSVVWLRAKSGHQLADKRLPASMLTHSGREPLSGMKQTAHLGPSDFASERMTYWQRCRRPSAPLK